MTLDALFISVGMMLAGAVVSSVLSVVYAEQIESSWRAFQRAVAIALKTLLLLAVALYAPALIVLAVRGVVADPASWSDRAAVLFASAFCAAVLGVVIAYLLDWIWEVRPRPHVSVRLAWAWLIIFVAIALAVITGSPMPRDALLGFSAASMMMGVLLLGPAAWLNGTGRLRV